MSLSRGAALGGCDVNADDPFSMAILAELATAPPPGGMSLPRLAKRLGLGVSAVLRQLSMMGDAVIGGQPGPALVRVVQTEERWVAYLTETGQVAAAALGEPSERGDTSDDEEGLP
jgi:FdhD protein